VVLDQRRIEELRWASQPAREQYVAQVTAAPPEQAMLAVDEEHFRQATRTPEYAAVQRRLEQTLAAAAAACEQAAQAGQAVDAGAVEALQRLWDQSQLVPAAVGPHAQSWKQAVLALGQQRDARAAAQPDLADAIGRFAEACASMEQFWQRAASHREQDALRLAEQEHASASYEARLAAHQRWAQSIVTVDQAEAALQADRQALRQARAASIAARDELEQLERELGVAPR
jgi:hypothetical protein